MASVAGVGAGGVGAKAAGSCSCLGRRLVGMARRFMAWRGSGQLRAVQRSWTRALSCPKTDLGLGRAHRRLEEPLRGLRDGTRYTQKPARQTTQNTNA
jgi:hypothetical protein